MICVAAVTKGETMKIRTEIVKEQDLEDFLNVVGSDNLIQVVYRGMWEYMVIFKAYDLSVG